MNMIRSFDAHVKLMKVAAYKCGNLCIDTNIRGPEFRAKDAIGILHSIIRPLVKKADSCFIYPEKKGISMLNSIASVAKKEKGKWVFDTSKEIVLGYEKFWLNRESVRDTIIWYGAYNESDLKKVFKDCYDPSALGNPGTLYSRSAIRLTRNTVDSYSDQIFFMLGREHSVGEFLLWSNNSRIGQLVDLALRSCKFSPQYKNAHNLE